MYRLGYICLSLILLAPFTLAQITVLKPVQDDIIETNDGTVAIIWKGDVEKATFTIKGIPPVSVQRSIPAVFKLPDGKFNVKIKGYKSGKIVDESMLYFTVAKKVVIANEPINFSNIKEFNIKTTKDSPFPEDKLSTKKQEIQEFNPVDSSPAIKNPKKVVYTKSDNISQNLGEQVLSSNKTIKIKEKDNWYKQEKVSIESPTNIFLNRSLWVGFSFTLIALGLILTITLRRAKRVNLESNEPMIDTFASAHSYIKLYYPQFSKQQITQHLINNNYPEHIINAAFKEVKAK